MERPRGAQTSGLSAPRGSTVAPGAAIGNSGGLRDPGAGSATKPPTPCWDIVSLWALRGPGAGCRAPASASVRAIAGAEIAYRGGSESSRRWVSGVWPGWPGAGERSP